MMSFRMAVVAGVIGMAVAGTVSAEQKAPASVAKQASAPASATKGAHTPTLAATEPAAAEPAAPPIKELPMSLALTSTAFSNGTAIPAAHTCDGQDASPPLAWSAPPAGTKSLVLIADDPDAPGKTWTHWVLYNIPAAVRQLPAGIPASATLPDGSRHGLNDFGKPGYGGPCPPSGAHRYLFKLYALKAPLTLEPGATKTQVEQAMQGQVLAQTQLVGTYQRGQ